MDLIHLPLLTFREPSQFLFFVNPITFFGPSQNFRVVRCSVSFSASFKNQFSLSFSNKANNKNTLQTEWKRPQFVSLNLLVEPLLNHFTINFFYILFFSVIWISFDFFSRNVSLDYFFCRKNSAHQIIELMLSHYINFFLNLLVSFPKFSL